MHRFLQVSLLSALVLRLAVSTGTPVAAASAATDIVAPSSGDLSLGDRWSPMETQNGAAFRWVDRDAELVVRHPAKRYAVVNLTLEAGPGLQTVRFPLLVKDARNDQVAGVFVSGHETVHLVLPVDPHADNRFTLSALGGGHRIPSDRRILNFRVFSIDDGHTAGVGNSGGTDVVGGGVRVGTHGWYPIETFAGQTFRWIANDATFSVSWPHDQQTQIRAIVEAGPSLGSPNFTLHLQDGDGHDVGRAALKGRGIANFPFQLRAGNNNFRFHVDGGGRRAPGDARTLNFRVFALSALQ